MNLGFTFNNPLLLIGLILVIIGFYVNNKLVSKIKRHKKLSSKLNVSGKIAAEMMLKDYSINDVSVTHVKGTLTDYYDPQRKTINLSNSVYFGTNSAAVAIAAHEAGHAVQHSENYTPLKVRSLLIPFQNASGIVLNIIVLLSVLAGTFFEKFFSTNLILSVILITYGMVVLISLITLPIEINASNKAIEWIKNKKLLSGKDLKNSENILKWAATTYLTAALVSIFYFVFYLLKIKNKKITRH